MNFAHIFRVDYENPGDLYSAPMHYLGPGYSGVMVDVFADNIPEIEVDTVIVGGGALMTNRKFVNNLDRLFERIHARHRIVWGVGFETDNIDIDIQHQFDLFSTREYKLDLAVDWVPCASALHPKFDQIQSTTPSKEFLVVDHFKRSIAFDRPHTRIVNRPNSMQHILEQIADHRFVVTSSYHVAYWSILAGKRCAVVGNSLPTKFRRMKHFPVIADSWNDSLIDIAQLWPEARYDSILANYRFFRKVEDLIGIENPAQLAWQLNLRRDQS